MTQESRKVVGSRVRAFYEVVFEGDPSGRGATTLFNQYRDRTSRCRFAVLLAALLPCLSSAALAQWTPEGVPICGSTCVPTGPKICTDGDGGAYVAWRDDRSGSITGGDIYLQRITAGGTIAPGWPSDGLPVCVAPFSQNLWGLAPDGRGGALVAWQDFRDMTATSADIFAQRILATGAIAPGWLPDGVPVTRHPAYQDLPSVASDSAGGAFLVWQDERDYDSEGLNLYGTHLTATGQIAEGWPVDGLAICAMPGTQGLSENNIVADGMGGMVVAWTDGRRGDGVFDVYAQRLTDTAVLFPGWAQYGLPVILGCGLGYRSVAPDESGGFYVGCLVEDPVTFRNIEIWAQRFMFAGTRASGWPVEGVSVCAGTDSRQGLFVAPDLAGGLLLSWHDYRPPPTGGEIFASRLLPDGAPAPGWQINGTRVSDLASSGFEFAGVIAPSMDGGAYIVWQREDDYGRPSFVQRLSAQGSPAAAWPLYGQRITSTQSQFDTRVIADGRGNAIVVWMEAGGTRLGLFAQRFGADGPTTTVVSLTSATATPARVMLEWQGADAANQAATVYRRTTATGWHALGSPTLEGGDRLRYEDASVTAGGRYAYRLGFFDGETEFFTAEAWVDVPLAYRFALNPVHPHPIVDDLTVAFSLATSEPAQMELYDLSGRRLLKKDLTPVPGQVRLRIPESRAMPAGIYWIRLSQGREAASRRIVIVR